MYRLYIYSIYITYTYNTYTHVYSGKCCNNGKYHLLSSFLDHPMTLALIVNQHHNMTHSKILTLPRGLPIYWTHTESSVLDSMMYAVDYVNKSVLLMATGSNWGPREYIHLCLFTCIYQYTLVITYTHVVYILSMLTLYILVYTCCIGLYITAYIFNIYTNTY